MSEWDTVGIMATGIGAIAAAVISAYYFRKTYNLTEKFEKKKYNFTRESEEIKYKQTKESEETKYSHDIATMLIKTTREVDAAISGTDANMIKKGYMAKLDILDWYAILVKNKVIENSNIIEYFKKPLKDGYESLKMRELSELMVNDAMYPSFKELCKEYNIN